MRQSTTYGLMLRFRDLVTEPGGNIAEHRKIIRHRGYAWWAWWARQHERIPREAFKQLLSPEYAPAQVILFDTDLTRFYRTTASRVIVAPSHLGVNSPDFEATPEHYVRGRYPAWFRFEEDIVLLDNFTSRVVARPTAEAVPTPLIAGLPEQIANPDVLRDDRVTLWVIARTEALR
ncbi:MAG: hypothetical protein ACYC9Z_01600 [Casimicrobiaceae bacterium]